MPSPRTNHSMAVFGGKLYLFGGTDGQECFNETWCFDPIESTWTKFACVGYIPRPCEGHDACIVGDLMYIYGGRAVDGSNLSLLSSLRLSTGRWYTFQNMGPAPSARSGHSMSVAGTRIITLGGQPGKGTADDLTLAYILDTARIRYPPEKQVNNPLLQQQKSQVPPKQRKDQQSPILMQQQQSQWSQENNARTMPPREQQHYQQQPDPFRKPKRGMVQQPYIRQSPQKGGMVFPLPPYNTAPAPTTDFVASQQQAGTRAELRTQRSAQNLGSNSPSLRDVDGSEISVFSRTVASDSVAADRALSRPAPLENTDRNHTTSPSIVPGAFPESDEPLVTRSSPAMQQAKVTTPQQMSPDIMFSYPRRAPTPQSAGNTPNMSARASFDGKPAIAVGQAEYSELERLRRTNRWLESELLVARQTGYKPTGPSDFVVIEDETAGTKKEIMLVQAILAMKAEIEGVHKSVHHRITEASAKLAEVELQRDAALKEAEELRNMQTSESRSMSVDEDAKTQADARTRELEDQLAAMHTQHTLTLEQLESARRELDEASLQVEQHREVLDSKHEELLAKHDELEQGNSKLAAAEKRVQYLESRTADVDSEIQQHRSELENIANQSAGTTAELTKAQAQIEDLQNKLDASETLNTAMKIQINKLSKQTQSLTDFEEVKLAIADSTRRAESLQKQLETTRAAKLNAEQKLKAARTELAEYRIRLEDADSKVEELTSQNEELSVEVESAKNATMLRLNKFLGATATKVN